MHILRRKETQQLLKKSGRYCALKFVRVLKENRQLSMESSKHHEQWGPPSSSLTLPSSFGLVCTIPLISTISAPHHIYLTVQSPTVDLMQGPQGQGVSFSSTWK